MTRENQSIHRKKLSEGHFIHHKSKIDWPGTEPKASTMPGQKLTHSAMAQTWQNPYKSGFYGALNRVTTNQILQNWMQMDWPRISRNSPDSANSLSNSNTEQSILLQQNSTVTLKTVIRPELIKIQKRRTMRHINAHLVPAADRQPSRCHLTPHYLYHHCYHPLQSTDWYDSVTLVQ